jgi:acyl-CoA synthetase (AMP-forming)/AMP-acid ligase II
MTIASLLDEAARRYGTRLALARGDVRLSFSDLHRQSDRLARRLLDQAAPGDRAVFFLENSIEFLLATHACERAGLIRVPVNARFTAIELAHILAHCEPRLAFIDEATRARFAAACVAADQTPVVFNDARIRAAATDDDGVPPPAIDEQAPASISYTSGTTGKPKGVLLSHGNWMAVWRNMLIDRDIRDGDRLGHVGPLTHASGAYAMPLWLRGGASIIIDHRGPADILRALEAERITVLSCVPTMIARLLDEPLIEKTDLSALRRIFFGAETMPKPLLDRALARFGPIMEQNYGLTEAMMTCITENAADVARTERPSGMLGRPYRFVEIVLRHADGTPVADGEIGEVTIRSPHVMQGYWKAPEETAKILRDGWLWSGDLARRTPDGEIVLVGRAKDLVISGGFNIYPAEVEAVIARHEAVREAAVFGIEDVQWGERLVACVALYEDVIHQVDSETLASFCKPLLGYKTPKTWRISSEGLPRTANGKVDKAKLRAACLAASLP